MLHLSTTGAILSSHAAYGEGRRSWEGRDTRLGLFAAWVVPLAVLAAVTWYRPAWAVRLFAVSVAAVTGVSVWFGVNPDGWRALEDRHGPILAILSFVLAAAVALLGWKQTAVAGGLLLVLGVGPVVVSRLDSSLGLVSLAMVVSRLSSPGSCTCGRRPWLIARRCQAAAKPSPRAARRPRDPRDRRPGLRLRRLSL